MESVLTNNQDYQDVAMHVCVTKAENAIPTGFLVVLHNFFGFFEATAKPPHSTVPPSLRYDSIRLLHLNRTTEEEQN
jgi:hypothetical protein